MESYDHGVQTLSAEVVSETDHALNKTISSPRERPASVGVAPQRQSVKYEWIRPRLWAGIAAYWLISGIGAGVIERAGAPSPAQGWRILVLFIGVLWCMSTERGRWKGWLRVGYVLATPFLEAILELPVVLMMGPGLFMVGRGHMIDPLATFASSLAVLVFAMRQSHVFVRPVDSGKAPRSTAA